MEVAALLLLSAAAAGALAGGAFGVAWTAVRLPAATPAGAVAALAVALGADAVHRRTGRFRPPALGRQVPRVWSRLFDPRTVAVLYGSRLGVGPLTVVTSWSWWVAAVLAASAGPGPAALAGAAFGAARIAVVLTASEVSTSTPGRMAALRGAERRLVTGTSLVAFAVAVAAASALPAASAV